MDSMSSLAMKGDGVAESPPQRLQRRLSSSAPTLQQRRSTTSALTAVDNTSTEQDDELLKIIAARSHSSSVAPQTQMRATCDLSLPVAYSASPGAAAIRRNKHWSSHRESASASSRAARSQTSSIDQKATLSTTTAIQARLVAEDIEEATCRIQEM